MPLKREILYPIFLECREYAIDIFWQNIFEDLSYGKTPYGSYISKNFLCCNYKKKEFSYKIESNKLPKQIYNEVYFLFTDKLGLISNDDKLKKRKLFGEIENSLKESRENWNNIKKKNIKEVLFELYVIDMKNKWSLSFKQTRFLLSIIYIGLIFKVITNKDIEYEEGRIKNVKGIDFVHRNILINKDLYYLENNCSPNIILEEKILMSDSWEKYLKDLKKNQ